MGPTCRTDRRPGSAAAAALVGRDRRRGYRAAAAETGLRAGTPVTAGTIDAAAEAISVGVVDPGDMMIMYGTTMFFIQVTDRPMPDPRMWAAASVSGSLRIAGGMSTTGALTRWFRDQFGYRS